MASEITALYDSARAALDQVVQPDGSTLSLNEAETRTHIIDPILSALGYRSLDHVRREHRLRASGQFVDYLLLAGDQRVVVEAKQIGDELGPKDASQLVGYCAQEGIRWAVLTSGLRWAVFDIEVSGNWEQKRIADIDLLDANRSNALAEALLPLTYFALDTLRVDDMSLAAWAHEERARAHLDRLLHEETSPVVAALVDEMAKAGIDLEPEDVVALLRRGTAHPTAEEEPRPPDSTFMPRVDEAVAHYVFPAAHAGGYTAEEHLRYWLKAGFWGLRASTAHRARLRAGDICCFYAKKVGIVAQARLTGPADELVTRGEWPGPDSFSENIYRAPLAEVRWLDKPVQIDASLRENLDAFRGRDLSRPWSWFIQSTNRLTEHDFRVLTRENP